MADENPNDENLKVLREKARLADEREQELAQARRELMFARAGIDTDSRIGKMLFKTWEGDDLEALKAEASELGLIGGGQQQQPSTPAQQDQGQQQFRDAMAGGRPAGGQPEPPQADPQLTALTEFHQDIQSGKTREAAGLAAIDKVLVQAASGNRNAIFDPNEWAQTAREEAATRR